MAEERQESAAYIGDTTNYNRSLTAMIISAVLIASVILCVVFFWFRINSGMRGAMREAKDVRIAMKMKTVEQYGIGGTIYQPASKNGMINGAEEEILSLAAAEGEIILQAWNDELNEPAAFTFQKDRYIVIFKLKEDGSAIWDGYYTLKLLEYE